MSNDSKENWPKSPWEEADVTKNQKRLEKKLEEFAIIDETKKKIVEEPDRKIINFVKNLLPVHSCSANTFLKILQDGCLKSLGLLKPNTFRSEFQDFAYGDERRVLEDREIVIEWKQRVSPFRPDVAMKEECPFSGRKVTQLSERECEKIVVSLLTLEIHKMVLSDPYPMLLFLIESIHKIYSISERVRNAIAALVGEFKSSGRLQQQHGIQFWMDRKLGTCHHVFSVLGPNIDYGDIAIVFEKSSMQEKEFLCSVNSSVSIACGKSVLLREWCEIEDEVLMYGEKRFYVDWIIMFHVGMNFADGNFRLECCPKGKTVWSNSLLKFDRRGLSIKTLAREICAQCRNYHRKCASEHISLLEKPKDAIRYACKDIGEHISDLQRMYDNPFEVKWESVYNPFGYIKKKAIPIDEVSTDDIINWYLRVNSHFRIEGLLPPSVPIRFIKYIIIPRDSFSDEIRRLTKTKGLLEKVVLVDDVEESLYVQEILFKTGKLPETNPAESPKNETSETETPKEDDGNILGEDILTQRVLSVAIGDALIPFEEVEKLEKIDRGSFGSVHNGIWRKDGGDVEVAIKEVKIVESLTRSDLDEFFTMYRCRHPYVLQVFGFCYLKEESVVWIVMKKMFTSLCTFIHVLKKGRLSWLEKLQLMKKITSCIHYLHSKMILHRDIKSPNFLVNKNGDEVCVTDFGISKARSSTDSVIQGTEGKGGKGTSRWMAPELFDIPPRYSIESDVYALGMVLYEILCEKPPFADEYKNNTITDQNIAIAVLMRGMRPKFSDDVPNVFVELVEQCWAQGRKNRPKTDAILNRFAEIEEVMSGFASNV